MANASFDGILLSPVVVRIENYSYSIFLLREDVLGTSKFLSYKFVEMRID